MSVSRGATLDLRRVELSLSVIRYQYRGAHDVGVRTSFVTGGKCRSVFMASLMTPVFIRVWRVARVRAASVCWMQRRAVARIDPAGIEGGDIGSLRVSSRPIAHGQRHGGRRKVYSISRDIDRRGNLSRSRDYNIWIGGQ